MHQLGLWLIFILIAFPRLLHAQPYYFKHYQINDGLSNNTVICSMQDSYGFLWFGTKDGLDRFDGNEFKHFDLRNPVRNTIANNIISLIEDDKKQIWIGTDQGIYIYNPIQEQFSLLNNAFANADVPIIKMDTEKNIWFVANGKLYIHSPSKSTTQKITGDPHFITAIYCAHDGAVYYGTLTGQIFKILTQSTINVIDLAQKYGSKDWYSIQKITENNQGDLLYGTSKAGVGIIHKKDNTQQWLLGIEHVKQFLYVRDIHQTSDNEYWFATESGLYIYTISTQSFRNIQKAEYNPWGISDNAIYNILEDKDGGIWLGTYFGGINYYHINNSLIEKFMSNTQGGQLVGTVVRIIQKDDKGNIWLGTENGGVSKLDPLTNAIENFNVNNVRLTNDNIHGLLPLNDKIILGTFVYGMDILDYKSKKVVYHVEPNIKANSTLKSNFLYYIHKNRKGEILLASTRGHYKFDIHSKSFETIQQVPTDMSYTTLLEDRQGNIWLGTWLNGIYMYHPDKTQALHFNHRADNENSLPNNKINCLYENRKGQIWVGTEGGIAIIDKNRSGNVEVRNMNLDLPSKIVLAILEDEQQNLWISTSKGMVRYNPANQTLRLFNMESGLPSIQFNYNSALDDGQGKFYFGTINGMIRFKPEKLNQIKYNAHTPIYITKLAVNNKEILQHDNRSILSKSILFTDEIELKYDESSFSLDFTALLYDSPHSIKYSYKLDGVNKDWVSSTTEKRAHFTKLLPGNYEFLVKADDPNGHPLSNVRKLKIKILPPLWASIPAFILYFTIIIGLIIFIIYHYIEREKQKNKAQLLTLQNQREQELYQYKINFYTDVVHEIRTPLTLIKAPLEKLANKVPANPITDKLLKNIQSNTERLISLSNQLLDFRELETKGFQIHFELKDISQITQDIVANYRVTLEAQHKKIDCTITKNIISYIDEDAYQKICSNLLSNALKYSIKHIELSLTTDVKNEILMLQIKNDGKLIPAEDYDYIFEPFNRLHHSKSIPGSGLGLALCKSLTLKLQGTLVYKVNDKNLNTFILTLPLKQTNTDEY